MNLRFFFLAAFVFVLPWPLPSEEKTGQTAAAAEQFDCDKPKAAVKNEENLTIVFETEFTAKCYFELYLDGQRKARGFIPEGTKQRWEAQESVQIRIGNAGGIRARINGKDYNFGGPGQVVNKIVTWKKDEDNPGRCRISVEDW